MPHQYIKAICIAALSTCVVTSPLVGRTTCSAKTFSVNANFEDLAGLPGINKDIPAGYNGLYYQGFTVSARVQTGLPLVVPHSPPGYAFSNFRTTIGQGTATLTTNFPSSKTQSFDLESFYFGCDIAVSMAGSLINGPIQCDIAVSGYTGPDNQLSGENQVCGEQFRYNPTTNTGVQQMAFGAFLSTCKNLTHAIFQTTLPGGQQALNGLVTVVIDDLKYKYTKCS